MVCPVEPGPAGETEWTDADKVQHTLEDVFMGAFHITQAALPLLRRARGLIPVRHPSAKDL